MKILEKNYMKIETALILCAGFGKRLNPMTLETPKPLLKLNNYTMLETCINTLIKLGVKKIYLNTFFLKDKIADYIKEKNFSANINIIEDGKNILDTGGGILNLIKNISDKNFFVFKLLDQASQQSCTLTVTSKNKRSISGVVNKLFKGIFNILICNH